MKIAQPVKEGTYHIDLNGIFLQEWFSRTDMSNLASLSLPKSLSIFNSGCFYRFRVWHEEPSTSIEASFTKGGTGSFLIQPFQDYLHNNGTKRKRDYV